MTTPSHVEPLEGRLCLATFTVTTVVDTGPGSLRDAIDAANLTPAADTINFNIGGGGARTIVLTSSDLPTLYTPVTIDATTQPGYAGTPLIRLDSGGVLFSVDAIHLSAGNSTVKGLSITGCVFAINIDSDNNTVQNCWIGVTPAGVAGPRNITGIRCVGDHNLIGGTLPLQRNVVSGNETGIDIIGSPSLAAGDDNVVTGNYVGTNPAGDAAIPNTVNGISIRGGVGNRIGGETIEESNLISGNRNNGVLIDGTRAADNQIGANYIGTDLFAFRAIPNGTGIRISGGAHNNLIGPTLGGATRTNIVSGNTLAGIAISGAGTRNNLVTQNIIGRADITDRVIPNGEGIAISDDAASNVISRNAIVGNVGDGIHLFANLAGGPVSNTISENRIGTTGIFTPALPNGGAGIRVEAGFNNRIGLPGAGNRIAGNNGDGIRIDSGTGNRVAGNDIGTLLNPSTVLGNGGDGIVLSATNTTIGGPDPADANYIDASGGDGIRLNGGADNNTILGNVIGQVRTLVGSGNLANGIHLINASNNTISGGNVAGNRLDGIRIQGATSANNSIIGVLVGLATDATAFPNLGNGVSLIDAADTRIGGTAAGSLNVISANGGRGIHIQGTTRRTTIQGNRLGTNANGTAPIASFNDGILIDPTVNETTIGGDTPAARNVIASYSIGIQAAGAATYIQGNYIGTDPTGTLAWGNSIAGVILGGAGFFNLLGGNTPATQNVISGNGGVAVFVSVGGTLVRGNLIGTGADGVSPLPNAGDGVVISATRVQVGSAVPGERNIIAYNGGRGVVVLAGNESGIYGNSIHDNVGLGIDLGGDGVTPNDPLDADAGPNSRQNFPVLTVVDPLPASITVKGTLTSTPSTNFTIDVYASPAPHASGYGQGQQYLGRFGVNTNAAGVASFAHVFPVAIPPAWVITATAQNFSLDSSEFSAGLVVPDYVPPQITGGQFDVTQGPEHRVLLKFSEDVFPSLQTSDFKLTNRTTGDTFEVTRMDLDRSTLSATLYFGRTLPDGNYRLTSLAAGITDAAGNPLDGNGDGTGGDNFTYDFYVLGGDANRDRNVDFNDLVALAQHYNTTDPSLNWFTADFNYDHTIDFNDLVILAQHYNTSLPAPAMPVRGPAAPVALAAVEPALRSLPTLTTARFSTKKIVPELPKPPSKPIAPKRPAKTPIRR